MLDATVQNGTYQWSTGDTSATFTVTYPDTFWVTTINMCASDSDTIIINYTQPPSINLGPDSVLCNGQQITLNAWDTLSTFEWNTLDSTPTLTIDSTGVYWANTTNVCGADSDTVQLWFIDAPQAHLGNDTVLCLGASLILQDTSTQFASYLWNTGSWHDTTFVNYPATFWLQVTNACGVASDTIEVFYDTSPITNLGPDSVYCLSSLVNLNAHWSRATYLWNTGDTTPSITANFSGNYSVQVLNLCGYDDDTVNIQYHIPINFNLGHDTVICAGDSILLAAPAHQATWIWSNGNSDSTLWVHTGNTFGVSASNKCGTFTDSIQVDMAQKPHVTPVNDTIICIGNTMEVVVPKGNAQQIVWNDLSTDWAHGFDINGSFSYTLLNFCGTTADTFELTLSYPADASLGNDTILCYGEEITKVFPYKNHQFNWSDGSTDSFNILTQPGYYSVTVTNPVRLFK